MPPFCLDDRQLALIMDAAKPLDPSKRVVLMERIAAHLRHTAMRRPDDRDIEAAIRAGLTGLGARVGLLGCDRTSQIRRSAYNSATRLKAQGGGFRR